ncbi:MAG: 6-bladed beta-propeller [Longimicrobiales bacterium]
MRFDRAVDGVAVVDGADGAARQSGPAKRSGGLSFVALRVDSGLALAFLALSSCGSPASVAEKHPVSAARLHSVAASDTLRLEHEQSAVVSAADEVLKDLRSAARVVRIGALNSPPEAVFGSIDDAALFHDGRVMVLDGQAQELRVFNENGGAIQVLGAAGEGPAEFSHPRAIGFADEGQLFVFEAVGEATLFQTGRDSLRFSRFARFDGDLFDACILDDHIYVYGMRPGRTSVIHAYSLDGASIRSFAEGYRRGNRVIQRQLSRGLIACVEKARIVLVAPFALPVVRAYSLSGDLLWWIELKDFLPVEITETPTGGSLLRFPEPGHHVTATLVPSNDGAAAVLQVAFVAAQRRSETAGFSTLQTFVICPGRRTGMYAGDQWPRILEWSSTHLITTRDRPYPELTVFRLDE